MLNNSFLACNTVELWDLKIGKVSKSLTLVRQFPKLNLSELFSCATVCLNFMFLYQFLFELSYTNTDEYSIIVFCKNYNKHFIWDRISHQCPRNNICIHFFSYYTYFFKVSFIIQCILL